MEGIIIKFFPRTSWNLVWVNANIVPRGQGNTGSHQPLTPMIIFPKTSNILVSSYSKNYHILVFAICGHCLFLLAFCFGKIRFRQPWLGLQDSGFYLLGGMGKLSHHNVSASPPPNPPQKKIKGYFLFDDDIKESVKVTNVQKCDFSQYWALSFQTIPGEHVPDPPEGLKIFSAAAWLQKLFQDRLSPISTPSPQTKKSL